MEDPSPIIKVETPNDSSKSNGSVMDDSSPIIKIETSNDNSISNGSVIEETKVNTSQWNFTPKIHFINGFAFVSNIITMIEFPIISNNSQIENNQNEFNVGQNISSNTQSPSNQLNNTNTINEIKIDVIPIVQSTSLPNSSKEGNNNINNGEIIETPLTDKNVNNGQNSLLPINEPNKNIGMNNQNEENIRNTLPDNISPIPINSNEPNNNENSTTYFESPDKNLSNENESKLKIDTEPNTLPTTVVPITQSTSLPGSSKEGTNNINNGEIIETPLTDKNINNGQNIEPPLSDKIINGENIEPLPINEPNNNPKI